MELPYICKKLVMNVSEIAEVYIDDIEIPDAPAAGPSNDVKPAQEKKETAKERYDKKTARYFSLKFNKRTDERLIEKLESVDSIQGYIKSLVQKDIEQ